MTEPFTVLTGGPTSEERTQRLADGIDQLADRRRPIVDNQRLLLAVASGLMTFGVCVIVLGWLGAAHSTLVEEQIPYVVSGGLLGLALALIGAVTFFAHWLTVMIREARAHEASRHRDHQELMEALRALGTGPGAAEGGEDDVRARSTRTDRPLRRAPRSS